LIIYTVTHIAHSVTTVTWAKIIYIYTTDMMTMMINFYKMDKLEKTDKMMFDIEFELEQENKKLVNRTALEKWISDGCPFEEDEDVLGNHNYRSFTLPQ
jgi:hypothetical protein